MKMKPLDVAFRLFLWRAGQGRLARCRLHHVDISNQQIGASNQIGGKHAES